MDKVENNRFLKLINTEYVWYACYGSNINEKRFMNYIKGGKLATKEGCHDKEKPLESRKYIFDFPIYFAEESSLWKGGMAFLDCKTEGKSYGKIYKIELSQFIDIFNQEPAIYDIAIILDYIDDLPVITFTASSRTGKTLNEPSDKYKNTIIKGLKELDYNLTNQELNDYVSNKGVN